MLEYRRCFSRRDPGVFLNFFSSFGSFVDLQGALFYKSFFQRWFSGFESFSRIEAFDFSSLYFLKKPLSHFSYFEKIFLLAINPRLELPLLFLRLRNLFSSNLGNIFSFGFNFFEYGSVINLGNSFSLFLSFLEGRQKLVMSFLSIMSKSVFLLSGQLFLRKDSLFLFFRDLANLSFFEVVQLSLSLGDLTVFDLSCGVKNYGGSFFSSRLKNVSLVYNLGEEALALRGNSKICFFRHYASCKSFWKLFRMVFEK